MTLSDNLQAGALEAARLDLPCVVALSAEGVTVSISKLGGHIEQSYSWRALEGGCQLRFLVLAARDLFVANFPRLVNA